MHGERTTFRTPESDDDFKALAQWMSSASMAAALTSDVRERPTSAGLRKACENGANFLLILQHDREPIGTASWRVKGNPRSYEISLMIADPSHWESGLGGEAAVKLVDHLFMTYDARRVSALTASYNRHALPALVKGGFTLEGVLRDYYFLDGAYHDATIWSILQSEHRALLVAETKPSMQYQPMVPEADKERARQMVTRAMQQDSSVPRSWHSDVFPSQTWR